MMKNKSLHSYFFMVCLIYTSLDNVSGEEELSGSKPNIEAAGEGRTLSHIIHGGHTLAEAFVGGLLEGSHYAGSQLGHFASGGSFYNRVPPSLYAPFMRPLGLLYSEHELGYGYSGLPYHRPGFHGTYASRPFDHHRRKQSSMRFEEDDAIFDKKRKNRIIRKFDCCG